MKEGLAFDLPLEKVVPDEHWETVEEFVITRELNQRFMNCLEDHFPWYAENSPYGGPIAEPGVLHEMAFMAMMRRFPIAPPEGKQSVHAKQESQFYYPPRVGTRVKIEVRLTGKFVKREKDYVIHEARLTDEGGRIFLISRHFRMIGERETEDGK